MRILFIHQRGPSQYKHLIRYFMTRDDVEVVYLCHQGTTEAPDVPKTYYDPGHQPNKKTHWYIRGLEEHIFNAQGVARWCMGQQAAGWRPDIILVHSGWGESLFLKNVWPDVPVLAYHEFFFDPTASPASFDPEFPDTLDDIAARRMMNATPLMALQQCDWGISPTRWQWSRYPEAYRDHISLLHDGVLTGVAAPNPNAHIQLARDQLTLRPGDEVLTFVARNLEPFRGFHSFMRALPRVMRERPNLHVVMVGGDQVAYGAPPKQGGSWKNVMLQEVGPHLDAARIHFPGLVSYAQYVTLMQVSALHVYLTYPFVLSWSLLEAMSFGVPVIGSRTAPVEEVLTHGKTGYLVDFFDYKDIADRILESFEDRGNAFKMAEAARAHIVAHYDFETLCLPRHLGIIDDLLNGRTPKVLFPRGQ